MSQFQRKSSGSNRNRLLIFPQFQLKLLGANLVIICLASAVVWYLLNETFSELNATAGLSGVEAEFYKRYLSFQSHNLNVALSIAFVLAIATSTLLTLAISHRFSGPLVRLRGYFRDMAESEGPVRPLSFRKNDFLSDLPPLVNRALNRVTSPNQEPNPETVDDSI